MTYSQITCKAITELLAWREYDDRRNDNIVAAIIGGVPITQIAAITGLHRAYIHQMFPVPELRGQPQVTDWKHRK